MRISCFMVFEIHKFVILLYNFLVIYFACYKEYMVYRISFSKSSDVLTAFTCAMAIGNLQNICLVVNILSPFRETIHVQTDL